MKLKEALKLSAVEKTIDGVRPWPLHSSYVPPVNYNVGAKRPYGESYKSKAGKPTKRATDMFGSPRPLAKRYLVAYSMNSFSIVWADTMLPISSNLRFWESDFESSKLLDLDDWEPL